MPCCAPARSCGSWPPAASRSASRARRRSACPRSRCRHAGMRRRRSALPRGRAARAGFVALPSLERPDRAAGSVRGGPTVRRAGAGRRAGVRADGPQRLGRGADLPAPGRDPAGDRAGGGARRRAQPGADRGPPGRPVPPAVRRQSDGPAALPDAAGADRLEPRPARRAGAGAVAPAGGLRRRLDARGGRVGLRRRRACAGGDPRPPLGAGGEVAGADRSRTPSEVRYGFLESLREYAAEKLRDAGEEATLRERHRDWLLALAERGRAGAERAALRAVAGPPGARARKPARGAGDGASNVATPSPACAWRVRSSRFWQMRGPYREIRAMLAELLASPAAKQRSAPVQEARTKALLTRRRAGHAPG